MPALELVAMLGRPERERRLGSDQRIAILLEQCAEPVVDGRDPLAVDDQRRLRERCEYRIARIDRTARNPAASGGEPQ